MFKIVFEDERYRMRMDKDTLRIIVCPIISKSIYADEGEGIELSYAEWNDLVFVAQVVKKCLEILLSKGIRKGNVNIRWLIDRLQLTIGKQFDDYFYPNAYIAFANFLEQANQKIKEGKRGEHY
ncbi:MAG: hypothetical protein JSW40_03775 [Candidatus Omnitrophota bacterium]|nr:MAG: hypothetical protein JSW40_03775 [Candidatus Omnitrophota bacterium]